MPLRTEQSPGHSPSTITSRNNTHSAFPRSRPRAGGGVSVAFRHCSGSFRHVCNRFGGLLALTVHRSLQATALPGSPVMSSKKKQAIPTSTLSLKVPRAVLRQLAHSVGTSTCGRHLLEMGKGFSLARGKKKRREVCLCDRMLVRLAMSSSP